jgi:hypothetical protein
MKLIDSVGGVTINLPNDMLWTDEMKWSALTAVNTYTVTGALIIQQALRLSGRPITLSYPDSEMAWVTRTTVQALLALAAIPARKFSLVLEYPADTRSFVVMFKQDGIPIEAEPVKGFQSHDPEDPFRVKINLIEVPA